ncbi:unnamed protein product [Choristocarpus tenellus]
MRLWRSLIVEGSFFICGVFSAHASYTNFLPVVHPFNESDTFRQDWCPEYHAVNVQELVVTDALRGKNVTVAMIKDYYDPVYMEYDEEGDDFSGGFLLDILSAVALEGGFEVIPIALDTPNLEGGETWSDWLLHTFPRVDLVSIWYGDSASRRVSGALFPFWFMDISLKIAKLKYSNDSPISLASFFSFLTPFTLWVWLSILIGTVLTAALVWLFEHKGNKDMFPPPFNVNPLQGILLSIYHGASLFTQSGNWLPATPVGRLVSWSWSVVVLVVIATYSAELTSSLIGSNTDNTTITSIEDAEKMRATVCFCVWQRVLYGRDFICQHDKAALPKHNCKRGQIIFHCGGHGQRWAQTRVPYSFSGCCSRQRLTYPIRVGRRGRAW